MTPQGNEKKERIQDTFSFNSSIYGDFSTHVVQNGKKKIKINFRSFCLFIHVSYSICIVDTKHLSWVFLKKSILLRSQLCMFRVLEVIDDMTVTGFCL